MSGSHLKAPGFAGGYLLAYSNREFYGERLLVYPSPVLEDPEFGVSCRKINGAYEVGHGRNLEEARAIVEEAASLMRAQMDRSIGIVAMNQAQPDVIETLIDEKTALARLSQLASGIDEFTGKTPKSANQINGELRKTKCSEDQPSFQLQYWF